MRGMDALNTLYDKYSGDDEFLEDDKLFSIVEKELKALEIIRKKKVDVATLKSICNNSHDTYNAEYEEIHGSSFDKDLTTEDDNYITKEEYDLLKEVLKNE